MLDDRNSNMFGRRANPVAAARQTVLWLIAINVIAFLLVRPGTELFARLALSMPGLRSGWWFEPLTAMFLHFDFFHILFNMWSLYIFGMIVAPMIGRVRFLALYFISGLAGNLLWMAANFDNGNSLLVGASGAVFGVMVAVAMLAPNLPFVMLFFPVPLKARTMVIVFAVIEVMSELGHGDNIAHLAHLGGFAAGYVFILLAVKRQVKFRLFDFLRPGPRLWTPGSGGSSGTASDRERLDSLLDKISREGINSLSPEEMDFLRRARERMRGNQG